MICAIPVLFEKWYFMPIAKQHPLTSYFCIIDIFINQSGSYYLLSANIYQQILQINTNIYLSRPLYKTCIIFSFKTIIWNIFMFILSRSFHSPIKKVHNQCRYYLKLHKHTHFKTIIWKTENQPYTWQHIWLVKGKYWQIWIKNKTKLHMT